jgi:hypothetical protein
MIAQACQEEKSLEKLFPSGLHPPNPRFLTSTTESHASRHQPPNPTLPDITVFTPQDGSRKEQS